jgi:ABC-2 type transport system permease protein
MLLRIARFEFRYLLRNPLLWVTAAVTFAIFILALTARGFELGSEGGLYENAAYAALRDYLIVSMFFMFVTTSFVANAVIRDDETGFGPIVRTTRITKLQYVLGRFLGAYAVAALCLLTIPLAFWIGPHLPWADATTLGPTRLADHLYGYFLIGLPNILFTSALFFALATVTRSMMGTYLGVIGLMSLYTVGQRIVAGAGSEASKLVDLVDPFGGSALSNATQYWTIARRNVELPAFVGGLLYNRLIWVAASVLCLALAYRFFRFAEKGMPTHEGEKLNDVEAVRLQSLSRAERGMPSGGDSPRHGLPSPRHDSRSRWALLRLRLRFEAEQVVFSFAYPLLMAWGLYATLYVLLTQRDPDGRPTYPTTISLIPELRDAFALIPVILVIYYAGELGWRERDRRMHEIIDATPMPNWAYVVPKTLAMALVLTSTLLTTVLAAVIVQLILGWTDLQLGQYLFLYVLPATWDMLLLTALAVLVQALSPHKTVGWGVMVAFLLWQQLNTWVRHDLLNYGATPGVPLTEFNGASSFWIGAWTVRAYWGAFALLLLVASHLLWRRGTETRLVPRLALAGRRLRGPAGWIAGAALTVFVGTGAFTYYNTNILNRYQTESERYAEAAAFERRFGRYVDLPQPAIAEMTLDVALYPAERCVVTKGRYRLLNRTAGPIAEVHALLSDHDLGLVDARIEGSEVVLADSTHGYRIFHLDRPMAPGEERILTFETRLWYRGFPNGGPDTRLVEDGTFLGNDQLLLQIGMSRDAAIHDPDIRREYGLPELPPTARLEDSTATTWPALGYGWIKTDVTLSTSADQTPLAPGRKVSDVTQDGRRTARFVSEAPVLGSISIQSARYAERHREHQGIDLAVYYHPGHERNVDHMLDAMAAALDYYQRNFGPYQFDHARIVEFPGYDQYAQSFPGTVAYSEAVGFTTDLSDPKAIDNVLYNAAHELAHQYWAHQVIGARTEGSRLLSETMAQYSTLMVAKGMQGEGELRRARAEQLDRYFEGRAQGAATEPPLARVEGQGYVTYGKGVLAMFLLQQRLGEDGVNRALRSMLARYRFKGAPYPRTLDLIAAFRAEADEPEEQQLITDLFERVTLYDLRVNAPSAVQRPDGRWAVTVPVEARKFYADSAGTEMEAPLAERIEVGLFVAAAGSRGCDHSDRILMERRALRSGTEDLHFVTDRRPTCAAVDPEHLYIDRKLEDNAAVVR